ncbi:MAG: hypothetical protein COB30_006025 [Ectothiorhodospiraceae bacterium]|nr:hypothetical protein [Ectothiorhodospiraceae bacterium]
MENSAEKTMDTGTRYFWYWGKARKEGEEGTPYHLLPYHDLDVGEE